MKPRRLLFVFKGAEAASTRYRARVFYPYLRERGWEVAEWAASANPIARLNLLAQAARADVVVLLRKTFSAPYARLLRMVASLDVLSGGRLDLAVGLGWSEAEYRYTGNDWRKRARKMDETRSAALLARIEEELLGGA